MPICGRGGGRGEWEWEWEWEWKWEWKWEFECGYECEEYEGDDKEEGPSCAEASKHSVR